MHEVLINRLGGLSLPRKSVVRLTDRPDMTLDVYHGRKTTIQQQQQSHISLTDDEMDIDTTITTYNTILTDAEIEIFWKERRRKKPVTTKDVFYLFDEGRDLKERWHEAEGPNTCRESNKRIQKAVKKANEDWIGSVRRSKLA